jgi:hypothetical protein
MWIKSSLSNNNTPLMDYSSVSPPTAVLEMVGSSIVMSCTRASGSHRVFAPGTKMFLTIELPMMTADEMAEDVWSFLHLEWFRRPLVNRWEVGLDGPEPAVEYIVADEGEDLNPW